MKRSNRIGHACAGIALAIIQLLHVSVSRAQTSTVDTSTDAQRPSLRWGAELNVLWPIFPGNIYRANVTLEAWRDHDLAGDVFLGFIARPFEFRKEEGDFSNYALVVGYRQFLWEGLHVEFMNAFGPGFNRNNAITGKDYTSWDYEIGLLAGYRLELFGQETTSNLGFSPYISTQHGVQYVAAKSNPHPIIGQTSESAIYVGTLNIGIRF